MKTYPATIEEKTPNWKKKCEVCGAIPTLPLTKMCGPCTFGEAETSGGIWCENWRKPLEK